MERALNPWQCFLYAQGLYQSSCQQETKKIPGCNQPHSSFLQNKTEKKRVRLGPNLSDIFWSQRWALLAKVTVFGPQKMALPVAKSKF